MVEIPASPSHRFGRWEQLSLIGALALLGFCLLRIWSTAPPPHVPLSTAINSPPVDPPLKEASSPSLPELPEKDVVKTPLRVSPETTVITSPLLPDGRPDYVAYLNQKYSEGITPENNAAVILAPLFDWSSMPVEAQYEYFQKLGISVPEGKVRLISWEDFTKSKGIKEPRFWELISAYRDPGRRYKPADHPEIAEFLSANDSQLNVAAEGLQRDRCYWPIPEGFGRALQVRDGFPLPQEIYQLGKLFNLRSLHRRQTGDIPGAIADAISVFRVSRLPLAGRSQGHAIENVGIARLEGLILSGELDAAAVERIRAELENLPRPVSAAEEIDVSERMFLLEATSALSVSSPERPLRFRLKRGADVNEILTMVNRALDELVVIAHPSDLRTRRQEMLAWDKNHDPMSINGFSSFFHPTRENTPVVIGLGNALPVLGMNFSYRISQESRFLVKRALLDHALSLAKYRAAHGRFPDSLEQLVPEFEPQVPRDPWTEGKLKYSSWNGSFDLWSCGPDGVDNNDLDSIIDGSDNVEFGPGRFPEFTTGEIRDLDEDL